MDAIVYRPLIELTAEEAYWHACTGTPWEQRYGDPVPLQLDEACIGSKVFAVNPYQWRRHFEMSVK